MKLLRAEFQNFRLLRDLKLEFSNDPNKNLTVIRAANESGKTTILHGLQWALYGDRALPGKGENFRLHPIDWDAGESKSVPITAIVEFELTTHRRTAGDVRERRHHYRLVRSTFEDVDSQNRRSKSTIKLLELNDTGARPIETPEAFVNDELPPELREVFFTDGDRALSFIEADVAQSTKRKRVQQAIHSLLGLGVIEDAIKHVRKSATEANQRAKTIEGADELNQIAARIETVESDCEKLEVDLDDAKQQFRTFDERVEEIDRRIAEALRIGDEEQLRTDLARVRTDIKKLDSQLEVANKEHSTLFRSQSIAVDLLSSVFTGAFAKLDELRDQGKIPNTTIPVLDGRLEAEVCICGETLEPGDPDGDRRRTHIQKLIDDSQRADEIQKIITDLYYGTKPLQDRDTNESNSWQTEFKKIVERRESIQTLRDEAGRRLRALEIQLDALPNIDIQGLRETLRQYKRQRDDYLSRQSTIETQLEVLRGERDDLRAKRNRLLRERERGARILAELEVTQDVMKVLQSAYERITTEELQKVSSLMNSIFLEMIGSDPEQGAIIRQAEISPEFDIIVYGPMDRTLNPDRDLNGASRRALTLAFILALTKVSKVEAPNVIDTPLGMTSEFVRRSILRTSVQKSKQLILLLTHDEISGCEDIIDETAGTVVTLTNPLHYPTMLVNDPGVIEGRILRCDCNHRTRCQLCQRHLDAQVDLDIAL